MHIYHEMFLGLTFKDDEAVPFQMCKNLPNILVHLLRANSMFALIRFFGEDCCRQATVGAEVLIRAPLR